MFIYDKIYDRIINLDNVRDIVLATEEGTEANTTSEYQIMAFIFIEFIDGRHDMLVHDDLPTCRKVLKKIIELINNSKLNVAELNLAQI